MCIGKESKKMEEFQQNFDKAFKQFMEFMLFKRIVYQEQNLSSPLYPKLRQIISILNYEHIALINEEHEKGRVLNDLTNIEKSQNQSKKNLDKTIKKAAKLEKLTHKYLKNKEKVLLEDNKSSKIILFCLNSTAPELKEYFMEFVKLFDKKLKFKYSKAEFINIINKFCSSSQLGRANIAKLMRIKGCKLSSRKYSNLEGESQEISFDESAYHYLYETLTDGNDDSVPFHNFLPFLYLFFLCTVCSKLEEKYERFHKTLGKKTQSKYSLLNLFIQHGLSKEILEKKCITYEMTEKVVVEQINSQSGNMEFEDIDIILSKIKTEMKVDFASSIETEKYKIKMQLTLCIKIMR